MSSTLAERTARFIEHNKIQPSEAPTIPPPVTDELPQDPDAAIEEVRDYWRPGEINDETQGTLEALADKLDMTTEMWFSGLERDYPAKITPKLYSLIHQAILTVAEAPQAQAGVQFDFLEVATAACDLARLLLPRNTRIAGWAFGTVFASALGSAVRKLVQAIRRRRNDVPAKYVKSRAGTVSAAECRRLQIEPEQAMRQWGFLTADGQPDPIKMELYKQGRDAEVAVPQYVETKAPAPNWPRESPNISDLRACLDGMSRQLLR